MEGGKVMSNLYKEPNRHTCPDIDEVRDTIESASNEISEFIKDYLYHVPQKLEKLRRSNDELRCWGNDLVNHSQELEDFIIDLENQLVLANSTIEELENQIEQLKEVK